MEAPTRRGAFLRRADSSTKPSLRKKCTMVAVGRLCFGLLSPGRSSKKHSYQVPVVGKSACALIVSFDCKAVGRLACRQTQPVEAGQSAISKGRLFCASSFSSPSSWLSRLAQIETTLWGLRRQEGLCGSCFPMRDQTVHKARESLSGSWEPRGPPPPTGAVWVFRSIGRLTEALSVRRWRVSLLVYSPTRPEALK